MERRCDSNYKSDWKPLVREDDPAAVRPSSGAEALSGNEEETRKPADAPAPAGQDDVSARLFALGAEVEALRRGLLEQSRRIDDLFSLLGKQVPTGKKKVLWISPK